MDESVFAAVEVQSHLHDSLQAVRELIANDPGLAVGPGVSVRAEVLPRSAGAGRAELSRCYWSVQRPDTNELGFAARTLYWDRRRGEVRTVDFPDEPVMDWLVGPGGALHGHGDQARVSVLRYIPLRRVTFLLENGPNLSPRMIVKTKRRRSIVRATHALVAARRAAARGGTSAFRLPEPVRLDAGRRLLYVAELPGRALTECLATDELARETALHRLGRVHREVHELDVSGVPLRRTKDWLAISAAAADQVAALVPSVGPRVEALVSRLAETMPHDAELAFCHGDFVPSQILCDPGGWAVLDFDDAHHADPHAEVAALSVALGRELPHRTPADQDAARRAYLAGYRERTGRPLDPARWQWFGSVAQLRYLARRLVKGRAVPGEAGRVFDELDAGGDELLAYV